MRPPLRGRHCASPSLDSRSRRGYSVRVRILEMLDIRLFILYIQSVLK